MILNPETKNKIKNYLLKNTTYTIKEIEAIPEKSLEATYIRIKDCLKKYPQKIIDYYHANPTIKTKYTIEEIYKMNYNELDDLMNKLGLKKSRKKKQQTNNTGATIATDTQTYIQMTLDFSNTEKKTIPKESFQITPTAERDFEYLTPEEIAQMYPGEEYSKEELQEKGFYTAEVQNPLLNKSELIKIIIPTKFTISNHELDEYFLYELTLLELKVLYTLTSITDYKKTDIKDLPEKLKRIKLKVYGKTISKEKLLILTVAELNILLNIISKLSLNDEMRLKKQ